ncbi:ABC transporter ATP-binding protein/permease [Georgenia yuyongxinii]
MADPAELIGQAAAPGTETLQAGRVPIVRLVGVQRTYSAAVALDEVNLDIAPGESVAIVGRSGSGKSTLLNILGLLDAPTSGEVLIDGESVTGASDRARSRRRARDLGFVFQRAHLIGNLTVLENVLLGPRYSGLPEPQAREAALEAIASVDLTHRAEARARTLSGGEMQRVAIARTIARPVRLWLADEPTGNLDSAQSTEIIELLKARAVERGAALVVVTHEPDIADRLDRVITLSDGHVVADTSPVKPAPGDSHTTHDDSSPSLRTEGRRRGRRRNGRSSRAVRFVALGLAANGARARTGIVAAAVAVAMTVAALGLAQAAAAQVNALFDAQRATQVTARFAVETPSMPDVPTATDGDASTAVAGFDEEAGPPATDAAQTRWPLQTNALQDFPGVEAAEMWWQWDTVKIANGALVNAEVPVARTTTSPSSASDSNITWADGHSDVIGPGEVVLGETLAERLSVTQIDLAPEVTLAGYPMRVVGILTASREGSSTGSAFISDDAGPTLPPPTHGVVMAQTAPGAARMVADRMPTLLDPYGQVRVSVDPVLNPDTYREQLQGGISVALQVLAVVASLAGLVGVIFVNLLGVTARTAEFGVRRAFGATRGENIALVMGEGLVLALVGAVFGLAVGITAIMAVTAAARWQPVFDPALLLVPLGAALAFGLLAGLPPAIAAGRIQPADAVRT